MDNHRLAAQLMVAQAVLFAADTALIHRLGGVLSVPVLAAVRGVGGLLLAFLFARSLGLFRTKQLRLQLFRGVSAFGYSVVMAYSFARLPFADATAISYTGSLYITLFSAVLLGEVVGLWRWGAVLISFAGALLIARPGFNAFSITYLVVLAGTSLNGLQFSLNRLLNKSDSQATTLAWMNLCIVAGNLPGAVLTASLPPPDALGWLGLFLILGPLGTYAGIVALRYAEASTLAPYTLVRLVIAMGIAVSLFGEIPSWWSIIGAVLILAGCIVPMLPVAKPVAAKPIPVRV